MREIMSGEATPAQIAAFAVGAARQGRVAGGGRRSGRDDARARATPVRLPWPASTSSAPAATAPTPSTSPRWRRSWPPRRGRPVAKHGNRAASSSCGRRRRARGARRRHRPAGGRRRAGASQEAGIGFCFAPVFHPGMRHAAGPRREIGIPTVFNFLGPLTNPAGRPRRRSAAPTARMAPVMAEVLAARGSRALVFRGDDGLDELTTGDDVVGLGRPRRRGEPRPRRPDGARASRRSGRTRCAAATPPVNAEVVPPGARRRARPVRDAVLLNAAAALAAFDERAQRLHDAAGRRAASGRPPRSTTGARRRCWSAG